MLHQFATGELALHHDTFRHQLPQGRRYDYLRTLLTSTGILPPAPIGIERLLPWLAELLAQQPSHHAEIINRYAHSHLLRRLRLHAEAGTMTASMTNHARASILLATRLADWSTRQGTTLTDLTQAELEQYLHEQPGAHHTASGFITWLDNSGTTTGLLLRKPAKTEPAVTMSDDHRWDSVDRLLHDHAINHYSRVAGLLMLLFSWPLNEILRMTHDHIAEQPDGRVLVTFDSIPIEMPPGLSRLILDQKASHGLTPYTAGDTNLLFPGRNPGTHMVTERIRNELVSHGIHPRQSRSAALFALASQIPAPVLAEVGGHDGAGGGEDPARVRQPGAWWDADERAQSARRPKGGGPRGEVAGRPKPATASGLLGQRGLRLSERAGEGDAPRGQVARDGHVLAAAVDVGGPVEPVAKEEGLLGHLPVHHSRTASARMSASIEGFSPPYVTKPTGRARISSKIPWSSTSSLMPAPAGASTSRSMSESAWACPRATDPKTASPSNPSIGRLHQDRGSSREQRLGVDPGDVSAD